MTHALNHDHVTAKHVIVFNVQCKLTVVYICVFLNCLAHMHIFEAHLNYLFFALGITIWVLTVVFMLHALDLLLRLT